MRASLLSLLAVFSFITNARAEPPSGSRAFQTLDVGVYGAVNVNHNEFHDYWDDGTAGALDFVTPFYLGRASLLVRVSVNDAVDAASGFTSVFAALGWRVGRHLSRDLRADVSLHAGFVDWIFSDETASAIKYELEFASEAGVRADYEFGPRWHVIVEGSYQFVFTHERIELGYVSVGLARTFDAPRWIRSVLE